MPKFTAEFTQKTIKEIKLIVPIPYWAVKENIFQILSKDLLPEEGRFNIFFVETSKLVENSDFREVNMSSLFTLEEKNNGRISQILNHWKNHTCLDPPKIYFDSFTNKINFEDGRHRTKLAFFLDFKKIPIAIYKEDVKDIQKLLTLNII
ncbi:hypothetical protein EGI16_11910 [Chryseobacterium sp. G0240]|uniref:hypothetical protein n=1 Tax=Chryseobacterium sp. G0240 TaxID=2487066 RepID=UPI000F456D04|nr:hypothetical protein [Chryseobacterium sp. G0240]ROI03262.1 hypothetical protein EGI16_11910 [Chryseobacterium sp. G0240]